MHPVSPLVPVCYLDTRNILLNPTALPKQGGVTYPLQLFDIHVWKDVGSAPCAGNGGRGSCSQKKSDDDGKDTSLCISTQSQKKITIRDTAREKKSERLKKSKKQRGKVFKREKGKIIR